MHVVTMTRLVAISFVEAAGRVEKPEDCNSILRSCESRASKVFLVTEVLAVQYYDIRSTCESEIFLISYK